MNFHYDDAQHAYYLDDRRIPSVTQLIERAGLITGSAYFTDAHRERGTVVHARCTDLDLGVVDVVTDQTPYRGYLLAYAAVRPLLRATWRRIEEAECHPTLGVGGRPDRVGAALGVPVTIGEIKTGGKAGHHAIQTALQAILVAPSEQVEPHAIQRLCIYLKPTGRYSVDLHKDRRDFDEAYRILREFA